MGQVAVPPSMARVAVPPSMAQVAIDPLVYLDASVTRKRKFAVGREIEEKIHYKFNYRT